MTATLYVQIDDRRSNLITTQFGIPQGSILRPMFFNLYVADLQNSALSLLCTFRGVSSLTDVAHAPYIADILAPY